MIKRIGLVVRVQVLMCVQVSVVVAVVRDSPSYGSEFWRMTDGPTEMD